MVEVAAVASIVVFVPHLLYFTLAEGVALWPPSILAVSRKIS